MNIGIEMPRRARVCRLAACLTASVGLVLAACSNPAQKPVADTVNDDGKAAWWPVCDGLHVDAALTMKFPRMYHPGTHCNLDRDAVGQPETHFNYWAASMADLLDPIDVIAMDGGIYTKPITVNDLPATGPTEQAIGAHRVGIGEEQSLSGGDTIIRAFEVTAIENDAKSACVVAAKDYPTRLLSISLCRRIAATTSDDEALAVARNLVHEHLPQITLRGASSPTGSGKPVETALTNPTIFCDRILLGGALAENIKALNEPPQCGPTKSGTGVRLFAQGWVGSSEKVSTEAGQSVVMTISQLDALGNVDPETLKSEIPVGDRDGSRRELILPDLAAQYSSKAIRIYGIVKTTDPARGRNWAEVGATIRSSSGHILLVVITRPVDMTAGDAAVFAGVRAIIENDLPQISAKP